jgi:hypothetical protein
MADRIAQTDLGRGEVELLADADGHRRLFTTGLVKAGEVVIRLDGAVYPQPSRYSIQVGAHAHLDDLGVVEATNHSCEPTAFVDFSAGEPTHLRAIRDLPIGTEVTINYCATEEEMTSPFRCNCGSARCYGVVGGYRLLEPSQRDRLARWLSPYLAAKYSDGYDAWSNQENQES